MTNKEKVQLILKFITYDEMNDRTGISTRQFERIAAGETKNPFKKTCRAIDTLLDDVLSSSSTKFEDALDQVKADAQAETHRADREQFATIRDVLRVKQEHIQANADFAHQGYQNYKAEIHKRLERADMNDAYATAFVKLFRSFPYRFFVNIPYYAKQDGSTDWRAMYGRVRSWYRRFHITVPSELDMPLLISSDDYEALPKYRKDSSDYDDPA